MKKSERLEVIKAIIQNHSVETQYDLLAFLEQKGITPTQATISRDIAELVWVKVPTESGHYSYALPEKMEKEIKPALTGLHTIQSLSELHPFNPCLLAIDVIPGNSRLIKKTLLKRYGDKIFSILSDDDSLLLITKSPEELVWIRDDLTKVMGT